MPTFGCRDVDVFADIGAVEQERVKAVAAVNYIAAVARIPDEFVIAGAELRCVIAAPAIDDVVAVTADEQIVAIATRNSIVSRPAIERELDEPGEPVRRSNTIVAAIGIEVEVFSGSDIEKERSGIRTIKTYTTAIGRNGECFGSVAAVNLRGVGAVTAF